MPTLSLISLPVTENLLVQLHDLMYLVVATMRSRSRRR